MQMLQTPTARPHAADRGNVAGPRFRPNNFDLIRIFAALQVVMTHLSGHLHFPSALYLLDLFPGVPIFFVTSGYLVSASFERSDGIRTYFRNRFLRIFPGLWGCLLVTFVLVLAMGYRPVRIEDYAWFPLQLLGVIYTPRFLWHFGFGSYNGSLWTIPVELQFYLLLPLAYWLARKMRMGDKGFVVLFALAAAFSVAQAAVLPFGTVINHQLEPFRMKLLRVCFASHIYLFFLGVIFQRFQWFKSRWVGGKGMIWLVCYTALAFVAPSTPIANVFRAIALGFVTLSMAYTAPRVGDLILRHQDISYGVYIYHGLLLNLVIASAVHFGLPAFVAFVACAVTIAFVSWRAIERPCLEWKRLHAHGGEKPR